MQKKVIWEIKLGEHNFFHQPIFLLFTLDFPLSKSVQDHNELFHSSNDKTKGLFSRGQHRMSHVFTYSIHNTDTWDQKSFVTLLEKLALYFKRRIYLFFLTLASAEGIFSRQFGQ